MATLQWLATQTGGRAVEAEAIVAGLARLSHDLDAYYALTYQPAQADGRFHAVEIRARRRNVLVHTRPGYWAPLGSEWRAILASSSATMLPMSRRRFGEAAPSTHGSASSGIRTAGPEW